MTTPAKPAVRPEQLTETLVELIRRRSDFPNASEAACCRYLAETLEREGIPARIVEAAPDRPNLYAMLEGHGEGPTIILNGHLDVVPADDAAWTLPPYEPVIRDGRVFGRGAADMKAGIASCLHAAIALKRAGSPFRGRLVLFFNVDEERTNLGMAQFLAEDIRADFAIVAEPTENEIHLGHRGVARYFYRTRGTPEHVASAPNPDNAIEKMAALVTALAEYRQSLAGKRHPFLGSASGGVTMINGGTAGNIVPGLCQITMDRRLLPGETRDSVLTEMHAFLDERGLDYELETESWLDASIVAEDHPMVQKLREAIVSVGGTGKLDTFPASCEACYFTIGKGIPAVIWGPGSIAQAHINDEFVRLDEVTAHCDALLRFIGGRS